MLQVGDIVRFFDWEHATRHASTGIIANTWRIGIVSEIRDEPWDEDWDKVCVPLVVVVHNGRSQPLVMPNENNIGTWVEVISESR